MENSFSSSHVQYVCTNHGLFVSILLLLTFLSGVILRLLPFTVCSFHPVVSFLSFDRKATHSINFMLPHSKLHKLHARPGTCWDDSGAVTWFSWVFCSGSCDIPPRCWLGCLFIGKLNWGKMSHELIHVVSRIRFSWECVTRGADFLLAAG